MSFYKERRYYFEKNDFYGFGAYDDDVNNHGASNGCK